VKIATTARLHKTMNSQNKICQNCKQGFVIEPEDFEFYEKIKVPAPTWCPECRMVRRLSCANSWFLYYRNCDKCGVRTLSMYPAEQKIIVYCQQCWWSDEWDGTEYAMGYDKSRPFLEQVKELSEKTPYVALETNYSTLDNCDYSNAIAYSKNCVLVIWADYCENVCYSSLLNGLKFSSDCIRGFDSELCYGSIGIGRCYRTFFSEECDDCVDIWFCRNCYGCTSCIGCVNLSGATNCIYNVKYSKEEYEKKVKELNLESWSGIDKLQKEAQNFWATKPYRAYHGNALNKNVTGEYVYESKNSKEVYIFNGGEDCKYCQLITVKSDKDCYDHSGWGNNAELIYECLNVGDNASNCKFSGFLSTAVLNTEYSFWCPSSKNNLGCINLKRKSYSILNKQYTKEEYEKLKKEIIEDMGKNPYKDETRRAWPYGEFFQPGFSKFAYNNSNAFKFFPKSREEALKLGYSWNEEAIQDIKETIKGENLPEKISEVDSNILGEVISCISCDRKYKIISMEYDLLRKMNLPLLRECPKCREAKRFGRLNMPKLYNRNCAKCNVEVRTPYALDRPEIIYCEDCYQKEVY